MVSNGGAVKPPNPFNPGSPVDPNDFVGRVKELENFKQKLRQTASGSLASMAVTGGYGVGKTSFLHKCKSIAEEQNALVVYFSLNELDSPSKPLLARMLVERLQDKVREEVILQRLSKNVFDALKRIRLKAVGVEISLSDAGENFPNLQSALSGAWRALHDSKKAIVFLVDEAVVLEKNKAELMLFLRSVLEQLQVDKTPVMIVPAGKFAISGPSGTGFSPLVRTFPPAILDNFTNAESRAFIDKKLGQTGVHITDEAFKHVCVVTEGHPFVLTAYLASAYDKLQAGESELSEAHFKAADVDFVSRALAQFFARFYDHVGPNSKRLLEVIAKNNACEASLSELTGALKKNSNQLSPFLAKLVQDGAIVRIDRGKYRLFHHLFGEYVRKANNR